eukprot:12912982-Prorocentrum_lima.AAC.1
MFKCCRAILTCIATMEACEQDLPHTETNQQIYELVFELWGFQISAPNGCLTKAKAFPST